MENDHSLDRKASALVSAATVSRHPGLGAAAAMRRYARRLELRSYGLNPEHFALQEGLRAALAVAVPLIIILSTGLYAWGWSIFAAFWTCLCDGAGPDRQRRWVPGGFAVLGAIIAFLGAWIASFGSSAALTAGPFMVFLIALLPVRLPNTSMMATLLAVVAVVAIGFPHNLAGAAMLALTFFVGAVWAWLLINVIWRIDAWLPVQQASKAVLARLSDMAAELVAIDDGEHRDSEWHSEHGEHRRSVRTAMERLRLLLIRFQGEKGLKLETYGRVHEAAEIVFSALIALDHAFIIRHGPVEERIATAKTLLNVLVAWQTSIELDSSIGRKMLEKQLERLEKVKAGLADGPLIGCLAAVGRALSPAREEPLFVLGDDVSAAQQGAGGWMRWKAGIKQALRLSIGVVAVYYVATIFSLGYPYWATMAVVVVMQGAARSTWTRGVERILGSLLGGIWALWLLHEVVNADARTAIAVCLSVLTIALRGVNYSLFVVFLTALFIIITELLEPGAGIASARMFDNTLGSLAALVSVLALWPDLGPSVGFLIERGLAANQAYLETVQSGADRKKAYAARRAAGLASVEAEVAMHDLGGLLRRRYRLSDKDAATLKQLRFVAGEAAMAWHGRLSGGFQPKS
ncbi:FUSC family protein [Allorhizobium sp. BGMRC 0089]|uniref:FUSC family protein n=1 Tax=Allorhizobium sonneratiae TaxID=2934936 RepID=UPI002033A9F8|nr:FUSC family protein [Allorhizobium sonneratiae]MCM2293126.1 FUSC family protein [Allorhizobium sonneratiae]